MSGFTLGGSAGATLNGEHGGTLGTQPTEYLLDGQRLPALTTEIATPQSLTLGFRVQTSVLTDRLRPLKSNEGQVDTELTDTGGFSAFDRANGANTYRLDPPARRQPLRQAGDYHVRRYEETLVSQAVDEWTVEVEFVPASNRTDTPSINEGANGAAFPWTFDQTFTNRGLWGFGTRYGPIATDRVDAEFIGTGADGVERFEVTARLTFDQAHAFEAALSTIGGVRVRQVPDATNEAVDDTGGDATLSVASPTEDPVASGEYVVLSWESTRLNDAFNEVSFEIATTA